MSSEESKGEPATKKRRLGDDDKDKDQDRLESDEEGSDDNADKGAKRHGPPKPGGVVSVIPTDIFLAVCLFLEAREVARLSAQSKHLKSQVEVGVPWSRLELPGLLVSGSEGDAKDNDRGQMHKSRLEFMHRHGKRATELVAHDLMVTKMPRLHHVLERLPSVTSLDLEFSSAPGYDTMYTAMTVLMGLERPPLKRLLIKGCTVETLKALEYGLALVDTRSEPRQHVTPETIAAASTLTHVSLSMVDIGASSMVPSVMKHFLLRVSSLQLVDLQLIRVTSTVQSLEQLFRTCSHLQRFDMQECEIRSDNQTTTIADWLSRMPCKLVDFGLTDTVMSRSIPDHAHPAAYLAPWLLTESKRSLRSFSLSLQNLQPDPLPLEQLVELFTLHCSSLEHFSYDWPSADDLFKVLFAAPTCPKLRHLAADWKPVDDRLVEVPPHLTLETLAWLRRHPQIESDFEQTLLPSPFDFLLSRDNVRDVVRDTVRMNYRIKTPRELETVLKLSIAPQEASWSRVFGRLMECLAERTDTPCTLSDQGGGDCLLDFDDQPDDFEHAAICMIGALTAIDTLRVCGHKDSILTGSLFTSMPTLSGIIELTLSGVGYIDMDDAEFRCLLDNMPDLRDLDVEVESDREVQHLNLSAASLLAIARHESLDKVSIVGQNWSGLKSAEIDMKKYLGPRVLQCMSKSAQESATSSERIKANQFFATVKTKCEVVLQAPEAYCKDACKLLGPHGLVRSALYHAVQVVLSLPHQCFQFDCSDIKCRGCGDEV
jgi:hypothetical protein